MTLFLKPMIKKRWITGLGMDITKQGMVKIIRQNVLGTRSSHSLHVERRQDAARLY